MTEGESVGGSLSQARQFICGHMGDLNPFFDFLTLRLLLKYESTITSSILGLLFFLLHSPWPWEKGPRGVECGVTSSSTSFPFLFE